MRKMLEHRNITDEERMDQLEANLKEAKLMAEDADRKYDEVEFRQCRETLIRLAVQTPHLFLIQLLRPLFLFLLASSSFSEVRHLTKPFLATIIVDGGSTSVPVVWNEKQKLKENKRETLPAILTVCLNWLNIKCRVFLRLID